MWRWNGDERPPFADPVEAGQRSVWDFPRPPIARPFGREVVIRTPDAELARSNRAIEVCETASPPTVYLPPEDVARELLIDGGRPTVCEWKGQAKHWRLRGGRAEPVAWSYPDPFPEFAVLRDWFAFYPRRVECTADGNQVESQSGGFYGGWITPDLRGPWKGGPGSSSW